MENSEEKFSVTVDIPEFKTPEPDEYVRLLLNEPEPADFSDLKSMTETLTWSLAIAFHDAWVTIMQKQGWEREYNYSLEKKTHPFLHEFYNLPLGQKTKVFNVFKKYQVTELSLSLSSPSSRETHDEKFSNPELPAKRRRKSKANEARA